MQTTKKRLVNQGRKCPRWRLLPCVALLWASPSWALVSLDNQPLAGVGATYGPNIVLALSVEFPTAGKAYLSSTLNADELTSGHLGYFDDRKCYKYDSTGGYFYPTAIRGSNGVSNGYIAACNGGDNEFSGNALNFLTMSAIDIFRQTMTGGNRAYGTTTDASSYAAGDRIGATYLRRANVVANQNGRGTHFGKGISIDSRDQDVLKKALPTSFFSWGNSTEYPNKSLAITNTEFGFTITAQQWKVESTYVSANKNPPSGYGDCDRPYNRFRKCFKTTYIRNRSDSYNVVVRVCDPSVGLESNCVKQPDGNYKPEGLLQQYSKDSSGQPLDADQAMRVAAFGYLNIQNNNIDGGVLRARMKTLLNPGSLRKEKGAAPSIAIGSEWDTETGRFVVNPDAGDAASTAQKVGSAITNSGVINYLNKFGDARGYKQYDPGAELYYTAVRYLRNGAWTGSGSSQQRNASQPKAPYQLSTYNADAADNFPVIYDWEDPLNSVKGAQCRSNTIIYIGDTNTHEDKNLPNFDNNILGDNIQTKSALEKLLGFQNVTSWSWDTNVGSESSPAGIAGLAYWTHSFDVRPDMSGNQYLNNFMVDVLERNKLKGGTDSAIKNSYWLAAKYGGFDRALAGSPDSSGYLNPNVNRASWTDAAANVNTFGSDMGYIPRNFAPANSPSNMVSALKKAMSTAGAQTGVAQTGLSTINTETQIVDLSGEDSLVVQSQFNGTDWTGDVVVYSVVLQNGHLALTQRWSLGETLTAAYHNNNFTARSRYVYTWNNGQTSFASAPNSLFGADSGVDVASLKNYILGDSSQEGTTYRKRTSIVGTVVNSPVVGFQKTLSNGQKEQYFAVAANDGMLHIFRVNRSSIGALSGEEIFAYIPRAVLPGLSSYADQHYSHRYLNDGALTLKKLKVGNTEKTYLVGTTGRGDSQGKSAFYALDITDPAQPQLLMEYGTDDSSDFGHVLGEPVVTLDKAGQPVAIVGSGYLNSANADADGKGELFVFNLNSKNLQRRIALGNENVGAAFGFDSDGDGTADRVYLGDDDGNLWRVDNTSGSTWKVAYGSDGEPLYKAADGAQPITGTPYAKRIGGKVYVLAGTGRYLNSNDLNANQQNYAMGFFDECPSAGSNDAQCTSITDSKLGLQAVGTATALPSYANLSLGQVTNHTLAADARGWRVALPKGALIAGHADIRENRVAIFPVVSKQEIADTCSASGSTSILGVDVRNGGQYSYALFDTNGDGLVNGQDSVGGYLTKSNYMNPEHSIVDTNVGSFVFVNPGDEENTLFHVTTKPRYVKRLSWREVFNYR